MRVCSVAFDRRSGQQEFLLGELSWTGHTSGLERIARRPVSLNVRSHQLACKEATRGSRLARHPARSRECPAGERSSTEQLAALNWQMDHRRLRTSDWSLSDRPDPGRLARCETVVSPETVSKLCQHRQITEAVEALGILVQTYHPISTSLFYTVIKACKAEKTVFLGRRVHALTVVQGYESDTFLCNHILRMYASHDRLQEAMDVFTVVAKPDVFMWSSIISSHAQNGQAKHAIQLYCQMRRSSVKPDGHVFVAALQACAKEADLETGQQVHDDVLASGSEPDMFVSSCLVDMYAKCGSLEDAQRVFERLPQKNVVTWTSLLAGYSQQGMGQEAIRLYNTMQQEGIAKPDSVTLVCLLQACASVGTQALVKGMQLHAQIRDLGLEADVFVANTLINMYAKCGSIQDAQSVFHGLGEKDVVTWNSMIAAYSQQGMGEEALHLYRAMQQGGMIAPNSVTFVCLLQACASVGTQALEQGKQLHVQIGDHGLEADVAIGNNLINMYAKCGSLGDARTMFDRLEIKDVVTWTALIAGYSQQGMGEEAFHLYRAMLVDGVATPDAVTFVCLLQGCASLGTRALDTGKQLHAQINEQGLQLNVSVANSLISMYAKCGSIEEAQRVFDGISEKYVATWNSMIAGYSQEGMGQEALHLFSAMEQEGSAEPDTMTFVCLLQACAGIGDAALADGKQLHAQIRERGIEVDLILGCSLVNMYAKCGSLEEAQSVFNRLGEKDVVTWNAMIAGYSQQGMVGKALELHTAMQEAGIVTSDSVTFVCLLQACACVGTPALEIGKRLHAQIGEQGLASHLAVSNNLINMYAKCGSLEDARSVFYGLVQKDVVTWTTLIAGFSQQGMGDEALELYSAMQGEGLQALDSVTFVCLLQACAAVGSPALDIGKQLHAKIGEQGLQADLFVGNSLISMYAKCGSLQEAQDVFDRLPQRDVVTWTALIAGYGEQGMDVEALSVYSAMQQGCRTPPDVVTFVCLLQACASLAALHAGKQLHAQIKEQGLEGDSAIATSLINMYAKSGSMFDAQQVFNSLSKRDIVTWNTIIAGYSRQGDSEVVFDLIHRMQEARIRPNSITFVSLLTVCSHAGLVDKGHEYFEAMSGQYGISPTAEHYSCMVDLLGRAGHLHQALAVVMATPIQLDGTVWHTLLGACQKWSNVEIGRYAFYEAMKLDEKDASAYALMSNIYTSVQMWEEAEQMHVRRTSIRAWKQPGRSWWTDVDGTIHGFMVGDRKHPESKSIHARLKLLISHVKRERYISPPGSTVDMANDNDNRV